MKFKEELSVGIERIAGDREAFPLSFSTGLFLLACKCATCCLLQVFPIFLFLFSVKLLYNIVYTHLMGIEVIQGLPAERVVQRVVPLFTSRALVKQSQVGGWEVSKGS